MTSPVAPLAVTPSMRPAAAACVLASILLAPAALAIDSPSRFVPHVQCRLASIEGDAWVQHARCDSDVVAFDESVRLCPFELGLACRQIVWYSCSLDTSARSVCPDLFLAVWLA